MNQTYICLDHGRIKGDVGTFKHVKPSSIFTGCSKEMFYCGSFCYLCVVFVFVMLSCLFLAAL